jgi:hypothetical protein
MFMRLRVHKKHPILTRLLNHADVQIIALRPLLSRLSVAIDHAGEERLRGVVAAARNVPETPGRGDCGYGEVEAVLY